MYVNLLFEWRFKCEFSIKVVAHEKKETVTLELYTAARRSYPLPKARGDGQEELPHVQVAVAAWVQEGLEELFHVQGQEGWR